MNVAPGIAVYSEATVVSAAEVKRVCAAINKGMIQFCNDWNRPFIGVTYYADAKDIPPGTPTIVVADVCDDPQALAYHTENPNGQITGLVGAKTCLDAGEAWSGALDHEVKEAAIDPFVDSWTMLPNGRALVCTEVCDPVQDGTYTVDGVVLSNYILPSWLDANGTAPFDHMSALSAPFSRSAGGYWVQIPAGKPTQVGLARKAASPIGRSAKRRGLVFGVGKAFDK